MNATVGDVDVDEVARTVQACPSVAGLSRGTGVEVATYLPGRRVHGVRLVGGVVEVHLAAHYGRPLPEVAEEVRRALATVVEGLPVTVFIDDLQLTDDTDGNR